MTMIGRAMRAALACSVWGMLVGCVVHETKPLPRLNAVQADREIPEGELLDVAVQVFDPGIPPEIVKDEQALNKRRIYPDIRQAESRYVATLLRVTLESSGQWGAVRVVPDTVQFVDVLVSGKIVESTGAKLALQVAVRDTTGRIWLNNKHYESLADTGSYKTDAALKARDPFQNVYSEVANDMLNSREALTAQSRRDIRRITQLEFARDLAPQAMDGYLDRDPKGLTKVARLPASDDPISIRIDRIRERDSGVVDTVNGYYANFADQMSDSYGQWRRRLEGAVRAAGGIGGAASILSGLKKYSGARIHAQALSELSESFQNDVAPQVVDVEGRTLKLTGTAEEQYREWRQLLHEMYLDAHGLDSGTNDDDHAADSALVGRVQATALDPVH